MCTILKRYFLLVVLLGCGESMEGQNPSTAQKLELPQKDDLWIFVMAGQSNMAGRGTIEAKDQLTNNRILTINSKNEIVVAKEPLHFYEPSGAGLDCGVAFGTEMLQNIPDHVAVLLIPTAVGGSSITQWINDDTHRKVKLLSNFKQRLQSSLKSGVLKGILWHQGEADAHNEATIEAYEQNLKTLFAKFRAIGGNTSLPIVVGKLGSYSTNQNSWNRINESIIAYSHTDQFCTVVETADLGNKGDKIHFNSDAQRMLGERYASAILEMIE